MFTQLNIKETCLATATHNFKCVIITHICLFLDQTFRRLGAKDPICHSNECQIGSFSSVATIYKS